MSFDLKEATIREETTNFKNGADGYFRDTAAQKKDEITVEYFYVEGDAPQAALQTAKDADSVVYITRLLNPGGSAGSQGHRYPVKVTDISKPIKQGELLKQTATCVCHGAPTEV
jgi:hypothetical protein